MWEYSVLRFIIEHTHNNFLDWFFKILTFMGEGAIIFFTLSIVMLFFKKTRKAGIVSIFALILIAGLNNYGIKYIFQRPRPFLNASKGGDALWLALYMESFGNESSFNAFLVPSSYAFMSGHTLSAFLFGFIVSYYHKEYAIPALILSTLMAFSRLYFGFHYLTDVLAGLITALLGAILAIYIAHRHEAFFTNLWQKIKGIRFRKSRKE